MAVRNIRNSPNFSYCLPPCDIIQWNLLTVCLCMEVNCLNYMIKIV